MNSDNDRFEKLLNRILEIRKDLTKEKLLQLVNEKKLQVGAGYLTDLGALYLVMNDLGIRLEETVKLSEIKEEKRNVNVSGYLISFERHPNRTVFYIFEDALFRGVYWGQEDIFSSFKPGQRISIRNASVKKNTKGGLEIHVNAPSSISQLNEMYEVEEILGKSEEGKKFLLKGIIEGPVKEISYKKKQGGEGIGVGFFVKNVSRVRVVLWDYEKTESIKEGQTISIAPVNYKKSEFGDEAEPLRPYYVSVRPSVMAVLGEKEYPVLIDEFGNVRPSKLKEECSSLKAIYVKKMRYEFPVYVVEECESYPYQVEFKPNFIKLSKAEKGFVSLEFILLSEPSLKSSNKYEMLVGDDTGEGKVFVPSELFIKVKGFKVGEKIKAVCLRSLGESNFYVNEHTYFLK